MIQLLIESVFYEFNHHFLFIETLLMLYLYKRNNRNSDYFLGCQQPYYSELVEAFDKTDKISPEFRT
ncbi:MAG: hypothetical protein A2Y17_01635 [Clostridiales bacterium GWF2_38_85]|nr:MAG: hypothetical protein A2Y17_01635 [Clostridiales bacterium GWF2_38_85]HBL84789.1 hypothetical protein [Clostridiales bacterium]